MQFAARRFSSIPRPKKGKIDNDVAIDTRLKRLFAVAASNESVDETKRRNVSKLERRKLVEEFVSSFMASNAGKFPPATYVKKATGGCYYVIREIVQELQYKHKMSLQKSEKLGEAKEKIDVIDSVTNLNGDNGDPRIKGDKAVKLFEVEPLLNSSSSENAFEEEPISSSSTEVVDKIEFSTKLSADSEVKGGVTAGFEVEPLHSSVFKNTFQEELISSPSIHPNENTFQEVKNISIDKQIIFDDSSNPIQYENPTSQESSNIHDRSSVSAQGGVEQSSDKITKSVEPDSNSSIALKEEAYSQKGTSVWTSLRSLADGIVKFWKNH